MDGDVVASFAWLADCCRTERQRTPRGEVDIVARRGRTITFVEVKSRTRGDDLSLAIDERRLARVAEAAEILSPRFAGSADIALIDVILITPGRWPVHLVNVWHGR